MRPTLLTLAALSTALTATPAQAEVVEIAPSSPWNVDFGATKCRLARFFGEGDARHLLFFEQYWPGEYLGMTVAGPSFARYGSRKPTDLRFMATQEPRETEPFTGTVGEYGEGVIYSTINVAAGITPRNGDNSAEGARTGLPELDKDAARKVEFVSVRQRGDEVRLMSGPLDEAFGVLDQCARDLIGDWGLDVEQHRTMTRRPQWTNKDAVVRRIMSSYPREALQRGEQGIMRMRVIVSTEGAVEDCAVIKATSTERLDSPACRAMLNARFEPALDAAGQPMRSYFAESIVYQVRQ
ncbi:MAG: energy transducer TonB [Erythrobacter sp.]|nr:energy transducer TonB [Erythrobacter sp.]